MPPYVPDALHQSNCPSWTRPKHKPDGSKKNLPSSRATRRCGSPASQSHNPGPGWSSHPACGICGTQRCEVRASIERSGEPLWPLKKVALFNLLGAGGKQDENGSRP